MRGLLPCLLLFFINVVRPTRRKVDYLIITALSAFSAGQTVCAPIIVRT